MITLNEYKNYLIERGYKEFSANARPSTAIDYAWRIKKILEKEEITLETLTSEIQKYLEEYGRKGQKWIIGRRSHESYINALKQFRKFVLVQRFGGVHA